MSVTNTPGFEDVLALARRLPPADRLRLIAQLAPDLAAALAPASADDAWDDLLRFADETGQLPPAGQDSAEVLSAMRR
jgi:hypothetical protein